MEFVVTFFWEGFLQNVWVCLWKRVLIQSKKYLWDENLKLEEEVCLARLRLWGSEIPSNSAFKDPILWTHRTLYLKDNIYKISLHSVALTLSFTGTKGSSPNTEQQPQSIIHQTMHSSR